jgi:hypothetical protein
MNSLSSVVEQLSTQLAERRQTSLRRRSAYVALAQAILTTEEPQRLSLTGLDRQPTPIGQTPRAA